MGTELSTLDVIFLWFIQKKAYTYSQQNNFFFVSIRKEEKKKSVSLEFSQHMVGPIWKASIDCDVYTFWLERWLREKLIKIKERN